MVDLPEVEGAVRLLCVQMQAGKAQHGVDQTLIVRFHGHAQHDFLERIRDVVMDGQDLAQMIRKMIQESTIDIRLDARGDVSWRSAQTMRNDRVCLILAHGSVEMNSVDGYLTFRFRFPGGKTSSAGIRHRHSRFWCSYHLFTHQPFEPQADSGRGQRRALEELHTYTRVLPRRIFSSAFDRCGSRS